MPLLAISTGVFYLARKLHNIQHKGTIGEMAMSWTITKDDVRKISLGAQVFSCGGGGKTTTIEHMLLSIMNDTDVIVVQDIVLQALHRRMCQAAVALRREGVTRRCTPLFITPEHPERDAFKAHDCGKGIRWGSGRIISARLRESVDQEYRHKTCRW